MRLHVSQAELKLLNEAILHEKSDLVLNPSLDLNDLYRLELTDDLANQLRDLCQTYLIYMGFDENYEATPEGNLLEDLIDKLYLG